MFRQISLAVVTVLALSIASTSMAAQILLDLGRNDQETALSSWNNISGTANPGPIGVGGPFSLNYTTAIDSGIDIGFATTGTVGYSGTGANYDGTYPAEVSIYPDSANRDGIYYTSAGSITATLTNLNPLATYDFLFYGAAGNTGASSTWTVTGLNSGSDTIPVLLNNSTDVALVDGIIPDGSNEISILMDGTDPGRWNVLRITENLPVPVPEPATGLIFGLGTLALLRTVSKKRRRRTIRNNV